MDMFLKRLSDHIHSFHTINLQARYKRRSMVNYINSLIEDCRWGKREANLQIAVREIVISILRYHSTSRARHHGICLMGKHHNLMYVAAKIAYDWNLKDSAMVGTLLEAIFNCERSFERLLVGAFFGPYAPHFFTGWKSDFDSQEENISAMIFFMRHATEAQCVFDGMRFIDVPITSCGMTSLKICAQIESPDKLLIMLRFGATWEDSVLEVILKKLSEFGSEYTKNLISCLHILLRTIPSMKLNAIEGTLLREAVCIAFPNLVEDCILPLSRCGFTPPELKHLCRCSVRERLWSNFQLPIGIKRLPLPESLHSYIDILED